MVLSNDCLKQQKCDMISRNAFGLVHECGHGCLFHRRLLNRAVGFLLGVVSGMLQYV